MSSELDNKNTGDKPTPGQLSDRLVGFYLQLPKNPSRVYRDGSRFAKKFHEELATRRAHTGNWQELLAPLRLDVLRFSPTTTSTKDAVFNRFIMFYFIGVPDEHTDPREALQIRNNAFYFLDHPTRNGIFDPDPVNRMHLERRLYKETGIHEYSFPSLPLEELLPLEAWRQQFSDIYGEDLLYGS